MPDFTTLSAPAADLAHPQPMRHGSVSERLMKCSKPGCACSTDPDARHGPYISLTYAAEGRTKSRYLSPEQAVVARQQIDAGKQFQKHVDSYWEVCQQWADQQLDASQAAATTSEAAPSKLPGRDCGRNQQADRTTR